MCWVQWSQDIMLLGLLSRYISFLMPSRFIWCIVFCVRLITSSVFSCKEPRWAPSPSSPLIKTLCWARELWKMVTPQLGFAVCSSTWPLSRLTLAWHQPQFYLPQEDHAEVWTLAQHPCQQVHTAVLYFRVQGAVGSSSVGPVHVSGETGEGDALKSSSSFPSIKDCCSSCNTNSSCILCEKKIKADGFVKLQFGQL